MKKAIFFLVLFLVGTLFAQKSTTGKIFGKITGEYNKPLPAVNILVKGENLNNALGAASDFDGNYFIINIPPGKYSLEARRIGYKSSLKNEISVKSGESIKIDFELEQSYSYELNEKSEQFYLSQLNEVQAKKLSLIKEKDKINYQKALLETFYKKQFEEQSNQIQSISSDKILQLTKMIDELSKKYKSTEDEQLKSKYETQIYDLLSKRFGLIEKKLEYKIQELGHSVDQLKEELVNLRKDKENIIKGQFDFFVK